MGKIRRKNDATYNDYCLLDNSYEKTFEEEENSLVNLENNKCALILSFKKTVRKIVSVVYIASLKISMRNFEKNS